MWLVVVREGVREYDEFRQANGLQTMMSRFVKYPRYTYLHIYIFRNNRPSVDSTDSDNNILVTISQNYRIVTGYDTILVAWPSRPKRGVPGGSGHLSENTAGAEHTHWACLPYS